MENTSERNEKINRKARLSSSNKHTGQFASNLYTSDDDLTKKVKNQSIPSERNLIKKVKTFCINAFLNIIQSCVDNPKHFCLYNMKNKNKRKIFRLFKSDISKIRNFVLLDIPMRLILEKISTIIWRKVKVLDERIYTFNYFVNLTWREFILFCKCNSNEEGDCGAGKDCSGNILNYIKFSSSSSKQRKNKKLLKRKISRRDFDDYLKYVQNSEYNYGSRINADRAYLKIYDVFQEKLKSNGRWSGTYSNINLFSHKNFLLFISSHEDQ